MNSNNNTNINDYIPPRNNNDYSIKDNVSNNNSNDNSVKPNNISKEYIQCCVSSIDNGRNTNTLSNISEGSNIIISIDYQFEYRIYRLSSKITKHLIQCRIFYKPFGKTVLNRIVRGYAVLISIEYWIYWIFIKITNDLILSRIIREPPDKILLDAIYTWCHKQG